MNYSITTITLFLQLNCTFCLHNLQQNLQKTNKKFFNGIVVNFFIPECNKNINIKIFKNGSLHITGLKKVSDYIHVVEYLNNHLKQFEKKYKKIVLSKDSCGVYTDCDNVVYDKTGLSVIGYKADKLYYILNKKCLYSPKSNSFVTLSGKTVFEDCTSCNTDLVTIVDYNLNSYHLQSQNLEVVDFDINCINIKTNANQTFNNSNFYHFLITQGYSVMYNPERYSGIKLKLLLKNDIVNKTCTCVNCTCTVLTFLIFSTGNILVTNFKKESVIENALTYFQKILLFYNSNSHA